MPRLWYDPNYGGQSPTWSATPLYPFASRDEAERVLSDNGWKEGGLFAIVEAPPEAGL
jgi:hypothetical protein